MLPFDCRISGLVQGNMRCGGQSCMSFLMPTIIIIIAPYCCLRYLIVLVRQHSIKSNTFELFAASLSHHVAGHRESSFKPLNAELNPTCHLLALLRAHLIFHVSRVRVNVRCLKKFHCH